MKRIVVVDNDQDILDIVETVLTNEGYEVICTLTGEIVNDIAELKPDLILMDDWLSEGKGSELCKTLKSTPASKDIPVLLFSAVQNIEALAAQCCADGFIRKPFDIDDLFVIVGKYIRKAN